MRTSILAVGLAVAMASHAALAWNDMGHEIVAIVAEHYLTPAARTQVEAMLQADTDGLTAHDIASEATWADKYGTNDSTGRTRAWHFADITAGRPNIPRACFGQLPLSPETFASQGPPDCVIDKINQFATELANPRTDSLERLLALKFLLNLVGDIHQPLDVSIEEGNYHGMAVRVEAKDITPGDLYDYWNSAFVHALAPDAKDAAQQLIAQISTAQQTQWASAAPQLWALEAHQLGVIRGYGVLANGYDHGVAILTDKYVQTAVQTVGSQLSKAGVRLAYVINEALAPASVAAQASTAIAGDRTAGRAYALGRCSVCHVVAANQPRAAPEGSLAPDFQAIARTRGISATSLSEFLSGPHPTMPTMKLTQKQTDDVIAYILSLKSP
jgi:mono/diheme cytochrome c family protein